MLLVLRGRTLARVGGRGAAVALAGISLLHAGAGHALPAGVRACVTMRVKETKKKRNKKKETSKEERSDAQTPSLALRLTHLLLTLLPLLRRHLVVTSWRSVAPLLLLLVRIAGHDDSCAGPF